MADLTVEAVDRALVAARERGDVPEEDVALLWFTRAALLQVPLRAEYLCLVMGVSESRAEDIVAVLSERGLIDLPTPCPCSRQLVESLDPSGFCELCGGTAESHWDEADTGEGER